MAQAIERIEDARREGIKLTADMYPYTAGATGLDAAMPPWVQEGGLDAWVERLKQPDVRRRVAEEMRTRSTSWENLYAAAGSADRILLIGFKNPALKPLTGKSLAEVAKMRGKSPEETAMDLVVEDHTRVGTAYFLMSEDNVRLGLKQPWVSIGSDEASAAPEGVFLLQNPHPRAYGAFARFLGHYARDEKVATARGGGASHDALAGRELRSGGSRLSRGRLLRGHRSLRSRQGAGPCDFRAASPVLDRRR